MEILAQVEKKKAEAQGIVERANLEAQRLEREARSHQIETEELKRVHIWVIVFLGSHENSKPRQKTLRDVFLPPISVSNAISLETGRNRSRKKGSGRKYTASL